MKRDIKKLIVHHTGGRLGRLDSPGLIRLRHKYLRGFDDIGYHYVIGAGVLTEDGKVYEGRDVELVGAHAKGSNSDSIGVVLIGDLNKNSATRKQFESLVDLLAENCRRYGIYAGDIYGHKEVSNDTSCPGRYLNMHYVRRMVKDKLAAS